MSSAPAAEGGASSRTLALALGALGIVYGDIGTSPLYAIKECFNPASEHAVRATEVNIFGVLSLVFWSLTVVIAIKYLVFIMRADNHGEGGIFALLALVPTKGAKVSARLKSTMLIAALAGAALLYGDGIITPAISVLSAVEGLEVATKAAHPFIVPITCGILIALFAVQRHGTGGIGRIFGPIMMTWFASMAILGTWYIAQHPRVLLALNPMHAVRFFAVNRMHGFTVLGSVVLCITGGEALYADMGHFGRHPIRLSWFTLVFPSLILNYFGQGAVLLARPSAATNPFFEMVPEALLYPMVGLATVAAVIASQALISGAFSLTRQAVQLGFLPRVRIIHTSGETEGQIYIPSVNRAMMLACIALVLAFKESTNLAAAYGIAVTGGMVITSVEYFVVTRLTWGWSLRKALPLLLLFLVFDLTYFGSNLMKFLDGGYFPLAIGAVLLVVMATWRDGRFILAENFSRRTLPLEVFLDDVARTRPHRVTGTAVFMFSSPTGTSPVLLHHLKHNQVLHEQVALLSIQSDRVPFVAPADQVRVEALGQGFFRVTAHFGFMETPNVPAIMQRAGDLGLKTDPSWTSYYLGRETLLTTGRSKMMRWRKALFALISKNAQSATAYFGLPPGRVVELGMQIDL